MTKQDKELLLKDLCARLPYGVVLKDSDGQILFLDGIVRCSETDMSKGYILAHEYNVTWSYERKVALCDIKPYLRTMSSITEDEIKEWDNICVMMRNMPVESIPMIVRFVNSKYLDYYNLISKGLALEAPKGMYNF